MDTAKGLAPLSGRPIKNSQRSPERYKNREDAVWGLSIPKVIIYEQHQDPATEKRRTMIKRRIALALVNQGLAVQISYSVFQRTSVAIPAGHPTRSRQGKVYENAAFNKCSVFLAGGLTRTEKQPAQFSKCKSARVGHQ